MITSGPKTNFNLSPGYSAHKSSNHKFSKIYKISPDSDTNVDKAKQTYTNISNTKLSKIYPFSIAPVKKHIRLGHAGIVDHSVDLSIPDFKKV